jgi:hypothetical protein
MEISEDNRVLVTAVRELCRSDGGRDSSSMAVQSMCCTVDSPGIPRPGSPINEHLQISILLQAHQKTYKVGSKEVNKYRHSSSIYCRYIKLTKLTYGTES